MRCGVILVLIAIVLVVAGGQGMREALAYRHPVDVTCEQFMKSPRQDGWYRIKGCFMELDEAAYSVMTFDHSELKDKEGSDIITEVYLPVHSSMSLVEEKSDNEPPTSLVVKTKDEAILNTVREMQRMDDKKPEEAKKWALENLQKLLLHRDVIGMVLTGINDNTKTRTEIANLQGALAPGYVIVEEGKSPSIKGALGMVVGGIVVGLISILQWISLVLRFKSRVAGG